MVSGIFRMTLWNQTIPARLRGRTAAIEMVSYMSGPYLGNAEAGFAARLLGLNTSVVTGGALSVLGSLLITWSLPEFRRYRVVPTEPMESSLSSGNNFGKSPAVAERTSTFRPYSRDSSAR